MTSLLVHMIGTAVGFDVRSMSAIKFVFNSVITPAYIHEGSHEHGHDDYPGGDTVMISYKEPGPEMAENSSVVWSRDDFPYYGPLANRLDPALKAIIENMHRDKISQVYTEIAGHELLTTTGVNAPVSYVKALKRVYGLLKRIAIPVRRMDPSFYIGTYRFKLTCNYRDSIFHALQAALARDRPQGPRPDVH
ncbi:hypothetical protein C1H76_8156 [Elsinoe australis]|uniref:Uncharacterized protein n=1 Tax=Elsinoe australis TaxID=40998 RepID=A0A4U7AVH3_9PEZI|nr:hypothetical protein C1H76_8156 [Elsinoe australis]